MLTEIRPILTTTDIRGTVNFYTSVLGFRLTNHLDDWSWVELTRDSVRIMFSTPNAHQEKAEPSLTGSLYLYPSDVDQVWQELKDRVPISYPIETFDYGMREFGILDNNGYLLQFGQEITTGRKGHIAG